MARIKSEYRSSKSETISNALNSNDKNNNIMSIPFLKTDHGYTYRTSSVLSIGISDFVFVSDFGFRA